MARVASLLPVRVSVCVAVLGAVTVPITYLY